MADVILGFNFTRRGRVWLLHNPTERNVLLACLSESDKLCFETFEALNPNLPNFS